MAGNISIKFTKKGYRRRPRYKFIINTMSGAITSIKSDMLSKAFRLCDTGAIFDEKNIQSK